MPSDAFKTAAVLPVKDTQNAKHRLSVAASPKQRRALSLAMLSDMLHCLLQCGEVWQTYVITADEAVRRLLAEEYPEVRLFLGDYTLNGAAEAAARLLAEAGVRRMLFLHGDLPTITPADVEEILAAAPAYGALLLGDRAREGTNGLVLTPPQVLRPAFGSGSLIRHREDARLSGIPARLAAEGNASRDIDTMEDLLWLSRQENLRSAEVAREILSPRPRRPSLR